MLNGCGAVTVMFRLLGPLEVETEGRRVEISSGRQRIVLAALLLSRNRTVSLSDLADKLWEGDPPEGARGQIQKYVMRLRAILGEGLIHTDPTGYLLSVPAGSVDLDEFTALVRTAEDAVEQGNKVAESAALRDALGLWRSATPLSNVPSTSLHRHEISQLIEHHLQTLERRIDVDLALGRHASLIGELRVFARRHPLREHFWRQLMIALEGAGRRGDALEAYHEASRLLADELGVEPGAELRDIYMEILTRDDPNAEEGARTARVVVPHQLPMGGVGFVGRQQEIAEVVAALTEHGGTGVPVVLITGPAGVGKTALAVQVAHRAAPRFQDGQLYVDLGAYAERAPTQISDILGEFLEALGTPPDAIPSSVGERVAAFRSLLAGRRILLVVDNAGPRSDISSLVPGTSGCAVVVTSRHELGGLLVATDARHVALGPLPAQEARALVQSSLGPDRTEAEHEAISQLIELCGGFALALRIAVVHLLVRPNLAIADYVDELRTYGPMAMFQIDEADQVSLAAAFDQSYRLLNVGQQRLFRLASLAMGPDLTVRAAAALADLKESDAAAWLDQLAAASLLVRSSGRGFAFPDPLRAYGRHRADAEDPLEVREEARGRLLDYYITTVDSAVRPAIALATLGREPVAEGEPRPLASIDEERTAMVAAVLDAVARGPAEKAFHLTDALGGYFLVRGHTADWSTCVEAGLRAARALDDSRAVAAMLNSRGVLRFTMGHAEDAAADVTAAIEAFERTRAPMAAAARANLGLIVATTGSAAVAVRHLSGALEDLHHAGEVRLLDRCRENLIFALIEQGDLLRARGLGEEIGATGYRAAGLVSALTMYSGELRSAEDGLVEASTRALADDDQWSAVTLVDFLITCRLELGLLEDQLNEARRNLHRAERFDPRQIAGAKATVGRVVLRSGSPGEARREFDRALAAARLLGNRNAELVALLGLAECAFAEGAYDDARRLARTAAGAATRGARRLRLVDARLALATAALATGRLRDVAAEGGRALRLARTCGYLLGETRAADVLQRADVQPAMSSRTHDDPDDAELD